MSEKEMISLKHTQDIAILEGKVSELENWRKGFRKLGKIFDKRWEDNKKKIAELKGEVEINSMDGQSSINHIINIEKVLRELIENLRINDRLDLYLPKKLLEKFDGLGGEKDGRHDFCEQSLRVEAHQIPTDSKPPEADLTSLNYHFEKEFGEQPRENDWIESKLMYYPDEPRENDCTTTIDKSCNCCGQMLYAADSISCSECSRKSDKELISEFMEKLKIVKKKKNFPLMKYYLDELIEEYEDKLK